MFAPPFCPYRRCPANTNPTPKHCAPHGSYKPKCRNRPVPRFRCLTCLRTYSRQTFRMDFRDHKPHLNRRLVELLISGVGFRQSSRILPLSRRCTEIKARKISRHLRRLNLALQRPLPPAAELQIDEIETFEARRRERPVTFPILIEAKSRLIIWGESATLSPRGRMSESRRQAIAEEIAKGRSRRDLSHVAVRRTLARAIPLVRHLVDVPVHTDEKLSYPGLLKRAFGSWRLKHETTPSTQIRNTSNPLFPINQTEAIARDLMGRLRRRSWLASKKRRYLDLHFQMLMAWKNFIRPRFNQDWAPAAVFAGALSSPLRWSELLGWRQEQGPGKMQVRGKYRA